MSFFCPDKESVIHCYTQCVHLLPLFMLLERLPEKWRRLLWRKRKIDDSVVIVSTLLFSRLVKARVMIEFNYHKEMKDVDQFSLMQYMVMRCAVWKKTSIFFFLRSCCDHLMMTVYLLICLFFWRLFYLFVNSLWKKIYNKYIHVNIHILLRRFHYNNHKSKYHTSLKIL